MLCRADATCSSFPSYIRDDAAVVLNGVSLFDNTVARGSTVFIVGSMLKTYQVSTKPP